MIILTYIANIFFILFILVIVWLFVCSIIYKDKPVDVGESQSDRQKKNDDHNTDYYP
jgi:heme/copper-type cytochrome/quinol oxidase subunit 2